MSRLLLGLWFLLIRWFGRLRDKPTFVIDTAPAFFDRPFLHDAIAIHWVSANSLRLFARRNELEHSLLNVRHRVSPLNKQGVIYTFCKLAVRLQK